MDQSYVDLNAAAIDSWVANGWEWGTPIDHETFEKAKRGDWSVALTPVKPVPRSWFPALAGTRVLGLASGGGQQMPVFAACGAVCTVLDYSEKQLESERLVAQREGYAVDIVRADMTRPLPFEDGSFDLIFHPVANCYIEDVLPVWHECARVLKKGGVLLAGLDNGLNMVYGDTEDVIEYSLPWNPLKDKKLYDDSVRNDWGIQFSHTIEEQIGGQLRAGLVLTDVFGDTNGSGNLHDHNVPTFWATRAVKPL
ncbi:MAG: class I SAM-dependent methyltransferase [Oscillospiraceae bacterium]|nr:class I SAM-dependent methyltransferase [Oscillospiraceae bacterium]